MRDSWAAAPRAVSTSPAETPISAWAASSGARRRAPEGGHSFEGTGQGWSSASAIIVAATATSP
jgi:hypothetical protein